jgi:hypothetical protein
VPGRDFGHHGELPISAGAEPGESVVLRAVEDCEHGGTAVRLKMSVPPG